MTEPDFVIRTREALADPKPGDRFHEMYSWWTVVVASGDWGVTVLQAGGPFNLVLGRMRSDETPYQREQRRKRGESYEEWVTVAPWQERAEQRNFPSLAAFQEHMRGELLADRGLDVSPWPQQREAAKAAAGEHSVPDCQNCGKPIEHCEARPAHLGCSSAYGWIHANGGAHACEPRSDGPYAQPKAPQ